MVEELGLKDRVEMPGFLDDADLRRVVGGARLFVFPSLVEGFGLPTLEAMALGVACAVSELEPMSFVAGDAALKFDPLDPAAIADAIQSVMSDDALHDELCELGKAHAAEFSWEETARRTIDVYESLL